MLDIDVSYLLVFFTLFLIALSRLAIIWRRELGSAPTLSRHFHVWVLAFLILRVVASVARIFELELLFFTFNRLAQVTLGTAFTILLLYWRQVAKMTSSMVFSQEAARGALRAGQDGFFAVEFGPVTILSGVAYTLVVISVIVHLAEHHVADESDLPYQISLLLIAIVFLFVAFALCVFGLLLYRRLRSALVRQRQRRASEVSPILTQLSDLRKDVMITFAVSVVIPLCFLSRTVVAGMLLSGSLDSDRDRLAIAVFFYYIPEAVPVLLGLIAFGRSPKIRKEQQQVLITEEERFED